MFQAKGAVVRVNYTEFRKNRKRTQERKATVCWYSSRQSEMEFLRRTAGYTLLDHKKNEDILQELEHHTRPGKDNKI
jgi:hypothetical protein